MNIRKQIKMIKKAYEDSYEDIRKKYDLTMNEIIILHYLNCNNDKNTAKDLVDEVIATKSHISLSVENLTKRGLIEKIQDGDNKKIFHLLVTDKSKKIIDEISERSKFLMNKIIENIPNEDVDITEKTLKMIIENIENLIVQINDKNI